MHKKWPTLYKWNSARTKKQMWRIDAQMDNGVGVYTIVYGQVDGKKVVTSTKVLKGKNTGRANETSIWEQTVSDAQSEWNKKRDRCS